VAFARRGLAIGVGEVCWSASTLLGVPLVGVLIDGYGWRAPFLALGLLGLVGAGLVGWGMPREHSPAGASPRPGVREAWGLLLREPVVREWIDEATRRHGELMERAGVG
jgi:predicted MFS family arabinose efflux permease